MESGGTPPRIASVISVASLSQSASAALYLAIAAFHRSSKSSGTVIILVLFFVSRHNSKIYAAEKWTLPKRGLWGMSKPRLA